MRQSWRSSARTIWENPEPGYREVIASESICSILKKEGFEVETGIGGISTAIRAVWGDGKPAIGFLAEYDSLPGLSQECVPYKKSPERNMAMAAATI